MLFHRSYAPRGQRRSAKVERHARPGMQQFSPRPYRGWTFQLVRRQLGMTVSRTLYGVIIYDPDEQRVAYLDPFAAATRARLAAETWIDQTIRRRGWGPADVAGRTARRATGKSHPARIDLRARRASESDH
ncbi:MAG: hypothetical protein ACC645_06100 [Pirellulales bacterium]